MSRSKSGSLSQWIVQNLSLIHNRIDSLTELQIIQNEVSTVSAYRIDYFRFVTGWSYNSVSHMTNSVIKDRVIMLA